MSKREHAIALRDLALTVVRAHGSSQTVGHKLRLLTCRLDDVRIALQMPLQQQPSDIPPVPKYLTAHRGKPTPVYLPYVMDVWDGGKGAERMMVPWRLCPTSPARGSGT